MKKSKVKHCADMVDRKGTGYMKHFMKSKYLKDGHNTSGKTDLSRGDADSESLLTMRPPDNMGPDQPRPADPSDGKWVHNPEGGWSLLNFADPDYVDRLKALQGKNK